MVTITDNIVSTLIITNCIFRQKLTHNIKKKTNKVKGKLNYRYKSKVTFYGVLKFAGQEKLCITCLVARFPELEVVNFFL